MKKLSQAFDCQKNQHDPKLDATTRDAEEGCDKAALSEAELGRVSAAGEATIPTMYPDVLLGRHDIPADMKENKP